MTKIQAEYIEKRTLENAKRLLERNTTMRGIAKITLISKSTVHKDLTERLPMYNMELYKKVRQVLDKNKNERHIRGGLATRLKYSRK